MLLVAKKKPDSAFGAKLRAFREEAGLTQKDLADAVGITPQAVAKIEAGGVPTWDTAVRLAQALDRSLDDFITDAGHPGG